MKKMSNTAHTTKKSLWERALHAILFEVTAIAISAPLLVGVMDISLSAAGTLTIFVSLVAMLWNVVFNMAFDRMLRSMRRGRDLKVRIVHAMAFELGLLLMVVPMAAWWLDISLLNAFLLDIGLVLFFLPYTLVFNWIYDAAREVLVKRQTAASS